MGQGPTHHPPSWAQALRGQVWYRAWNLGLSHGSSCCTASHPVPKGEPAGSPLWAEVCSPQADPSLSKVSNSHTVTWKWPLYLLSPILYEVDGYRFIVNAFQGQS